MKKTIWQKIDRRIGRLKIFRNMLTIVKNSIVTDIMKGTTSVSSVTLDLKCPEPEKVRDYLIDNTLVFAGDLSVTLNYLDLKKAAQSVSPNLEWNENCAIFEPGKDEVQFAGVSYSVRSVIPQDWQNNQPGQYLLILKGIAPDAAEEDDQDEIQTE